MMPPPWPASRDHSGCHSSVAQPPIASTRSRMSRRSAFIAPPTSAWVDCPDRMRRKAVSTAEMPAASSPMKVREEPVTLWTIEMLPASRFDSWARNSVGRSSVVSFSLSSTSGSLRLRRFLDDHRVDGLVAFAAAGGDDHVHRRAGGGVVLQPGVVERQARGEDAEPLPVFHLALVAAARDLLGPVDLRHRMHRIGDEAFGVDLGKAGCTGEQRLVRGMADALAGDEADAGDHDVVGCFRHVGLPVSSEPACSAAISPTCSARLADDIA